MSEQVEVWFVGFPWNKRPLKVTRSEGIRTEKQIRVKRQSGYGQRYSIHAPGTVQFSEQDAVAQCLEACRHDVERQESALAEAQAQLVEITEYHAKREAEGWS